MIQGFIGKLKGIKHERNEKKQQDIQHKVLMTQKLPCSIHTVCTQYEEETMKSKYHPLNQGDGRTHTRALGIAVVVQLVRELW